MKSWVIFVNRTAKLRKPAVIRQFISHNPPTLTLITPVSYLPNLRRNFSRRARVTQSKDGLVRCEKGSGNGALVYLLMLQLAMLSVAENSLHSAEWETSRIVMEMKRSKAAVVYWRYYLLELLYVYWKCYLLEVLLRQLPWGRNLSFRQKKKKTEPRTSRMCSRSASSSTARFGKTLWRFASRNHDRVSISNNKQMSVRAAS